MEKARERNLTEESVGGKVEDPQGELERSSLPDTLMPGGTDGRTGSQHSADELSDLGLQQRGRERGGQINTWTKRNERMGKEEEMSRWEEGRLKEGETEGKRQNEEGAEKDADVSVVLADTRLTLDVYLGGTAMLSMLYEQVPEQLRRVQFLRLGSEDCDSLQGALTILPLLTQLRSLAIRGCCLQDASGDPLPGLLTSLPTSLSSLSSLTHLDLSFNHISSFPPCLLSLPLLSSLLLSYNLLRSLPPSLGELRSLTFLSLLGNELRTLPASLCQLGALRTLDLSHNQLESLPAEVGWLESLQSLELSHNRLRDLPHTLGAQYPQ
ncbi:hypothetical protein SKAU_G00425450 [Synaphobranchus kaupii]|uniref:Uncharacterized protein n=1 Tax=Synaphobranchus kaupii TaxID=118154 RepID=A0A9Q1IAD1_SYNKA|nr:hypothetical protein SKAU_G00425450 [Synaphobranchus kaupii]